MTRAEFDMERAASAARRRAIYEAAVAPIRHRLTEDAAAKEYWSDMQRARAQKRLVTRECEVCEMPFQQRRGPGRPAKRCPRCRPRAERRGEIAKAVKPTPRPRRARRTPEEQQVGKVEAGRRYYERHRQRILEARRDRYIKTKEEQPEALREARRRDHERHREERLAYAREYYRRNKEAALQRQRRTRAQRRARAA